MKDNQVPPASAEPRIFLVSPVLHCVSMTALVYLRSSFGFAYLRPKSIFFALTWAFVLYSIYAWIDGDVWRAHWALILFGIGVAILYWFHSLIAVSREWKQSGEHDHYSGMSHLLRLWRRFGKVPDNETEARLHLWGEPTIVFLAGVMLRLVFGERFLSAWLILAAACFCCKEAFNRWFQIRQRKRRQDIFDDTENAGDLPAAGNSSVEPPKATRKARVKRPRSAEAGDVEV